jgi:predicted acyl esterase
MRSWIKVSHVEANMDKVSTGFGAERSSELDREYSSSVVHKNVMIPMRDVVRLAMDVYFPSEDGVKPASGRFPTLLNISATTTRAIACTMSALSMYAEDFVRRGEMK